MKYIFKYRLMKLLFWLIFDLAWWLILFHGFDEFLKTERPERLSLSHVELTVEFHPTANKSRTQAFTTI